VRFLVFRQTQILDESDAFAEVNASAEGVSANRETDSEVPASSSEDTKSLQFGPLCAGFSGRCNKLADTCYSYWVGGSLTLLGRAHLINPSASRRYLLDKTQHLVGGFGKTPGDPPDIYHSYLGLASLAMMGEQGLKPFNAALCISKDAANHVESLTWQNTVED
jgi:geranylgeranyl transferase type-1 subunit beta